MTQTRHPSVDRLLAAIRKSGEFPAMAKTVGLMETIYRALGVGKTRVFFLLKDPSTSVAWFRFGFGQSAGEMKPWFEIPIRGAEDLFSLSFTHQKSGEKAGRASGRR
jgi:hypothetical protein